MKPDNSTSLGRRYSDQSGDNGANDENEKSINLTSQDRTKSGRQYRAVKSLVKIAGVLSSRHKSRLVSKSFMKYKRLFNMTTKLVGNTNASTSHNRTVVTNVHELRRAVLDEGIQLKDIEFEGVAFVSSSVHQRKITLNDRHDNSRQTEEGIGLLNHEVIKLIQMRARTMSKPGARAPDDDARLALAIEGGGMRAAVSAGMVCAIAVLGLSDTFDCVYGSSAGSAVGAYMVSRQMCIDVYTEILTAAKSKFISIGRLIFSLATTLLDTRVLKANSCLSKYVDPALNISFLLDNIMCPQQGLRPFDIKTFRINNEIQPLRIVTSCVRNGKMETHCLGSETMDFFDSVHDETGQVLDQATTMLNSDKKGLFACLHTSMLVPAATGPPLALLRNKDAHLNITTTCFDAFCYEPIPYRSAVEEGASHVLALKTRPDGVPIPTKPALFEKVFGPMHFDKHELPEVSKYLQVGGQQYIYTEDYLTLDEGKHHIVNGTGISSKGILVPPRKLLYGVALDHEARSLVANRMAWNRAHLFPVSVPEGHSELSPLSANKDEVLKAVRLGFASAFDLLLPVSNTNLNGHLDGYRVAALLFSKLDTARNVLQKSVIVEGEHILDSMKCTTKDGDKLKNDTYRRGTQYQHRNDNPNSFLCPLEDASELLESLPGFCGGRMKSLSNTLHHIKQGEVESTLSKL